MTRLYTMARLAEEPMLDPDVVAECPSCGQEFCEDDEAFEFDGEYYCTLECIAEHVGIKKRRVPA